VVDAIVTIRVTSALGDKNASIITEFSLADNSINAADVSATIITTNYFMTAALILSSAAALRSNIYRDQQDTQFLGDIRTELDEVVNSIEERHQYMSHRWTHRMYHPLHAINGTRVRKSAQLQEHQNKLNAGRVFYCN
jgi:hypothetical protein